MIRSMRLGVKGVRAFSLSAKRDVNYGFVGIGQMGQYMAAHVYNKLEPEDNLYIYDTSSESTRGFLSKAQETAPEKAGQLKAVDSLKGLVNDVHSQLDFIVTMVPEGKHVKAVVEELVGAYKDSSIDTSKNTTTFIDSSTIDIPTSIEVHEFVKKELPEFDFIDSPVSGGVAGARKGTLSMMLSRPDIDSVSPALQVLLKKMGKNIFPCGVNHGSGLAAKLANNYLLAITNLAVADSFQLAKAFGLNLSDYAKLVAVSTGKSWASVDNCPIKGTYPKEYNLPADVDFKGGFVTKLTKKDLVLATESAKSRNRFLFLGDIGKYWYETASQRDDIANRDLGVLYEWLGRIEIDEEGKLKEVK